jgi:small GTP-binding protein
MTSISKKIVLIGDFATGKTSLIRQFVDREFSDAYLTTIGVKISRKSITVGKTTIQALIWDVEGGTKAKPLNQTYILGAHGCIIAADITREQTVANLENYVALMRNASSVIPLAIALNKSDLRDADTANEILHKTQQRFKTVPDIFLTSAKSGDNVDLMFHNLAENIMAEVQ